MVIWRVYLGNAGVHTSSLACSTAAPVNELFNVNRLEYDTVGTGMDVDVPSRPTTATPHPGTTLSNTLVPVNVIITSGRNSGDHNIPPQHLPPNTRKRIVGILPTDSSRYDRDIVM